MNRSLKLYALFSNDGFGRIGNGHALRVFRIDRTESHVMDTFQHTWAVKHISAEDTSYRSWTYSRSIDGDTNQTESPCPDVDSGEKSRPASVNRCERQRGMQ